MNPRHQTLRIGEVAASSGLTVDAVRYYERVGLLAPDARTTGGFRTYKTDIVERLGFIRQAQRLGLTLQDIRELLGGERGRGRQHCQRVRALLVKRLQDIETQMTGLKTFRRTLKTALKNCDAALARETVDECPIVQSLAQKRRNDGRNQP